jgi:predicted dienelactone hydrolase
VTETSEHGLIASGTEKFPLLVFAPGLGLSSTTYTSTIQELVSHGYVIASVEPTYEVAAVVFPDGRVITEHPEATGRGLSPPNESREQFLKRLHSFDARNFDKWADDMCFVIGQITRVNGETGATRAPIAGRIDLSNIGAWGHSFGGRAARLCQIDEHVKACLDADGLGPDGPIGPF